jgi:hypothetical protein
MSTSRSRRLHGRGSRTIVAILVAAGVVAAAGGCDLRLDRPAPTAPTPGAVEQVRERAVTDALDLAAAAHALEQTPDGAAPDLKAVLDDVATFSTAHADALGGPYVSGLESPSPTTTTTAAPAATVQRVLDELATSSATALGDAKTVADPGLARLLASVGTARDELAGRLAGVSGLAAPAPTPTATPVPSPSPTDGPSPSPTSPAAGLPKADAAALVLAHDQAGYGFEVIAAKTSADQRATAQESGATHRAQADSLAAAAGLAGTPDDPRRAAYTLPTGMSDPTVVATLARSLETTVADAYATAVAHAPAGQRGPWITGLGEATAAARTWGAAAVAFPGMPEQAQRPTG